MMVVVILDASETSDVAEFWSWAWDARVRGAAAGWLDEVYLAHCFFSIFFLLWRYLVGLYSFFSFFFLFFLLCCCFLYFPFVLLYLLC